MKKDHGSLAEQQHVSYGSVEMNGSNDGTNQDELKVEIPSDPLAFIGNPKQSNVGSPARTPRGMRGCLDNYFLISKRGSTLETEIWAGFINFVANSYLLVLIPQILKNGDLDPKASFSGFIVATVVSSVLLGALANLPIPAGPGLGCATYFAFTLAQTNGDIVDGGPTNGDFVDGGPNPVHAITIAFIAGFCMLALSLLHIPTKVFDLVPCCVKDAMPIGLGLLLSFCGLQQIRLVIPTSDTGVGCGSFDDHNVLFGLGGTMLMAFLEHKRSSASFAIPIIVITLIAWFSEYAPWPYGVVATPSLDGGSYDFTTVGRFMEWFPPTAAIYIICLFDIAGIMYSVAKVAGLVDERTSSVPHSYWVFVSCAVGSLVSAALGCSPCIVFGESFAGVLVGGKTGITAITMGIFFLLVMPFSPIITAVPLFASAPVLIILGVTLTGLLRFLAWESIMDSLPSFFVIVLMPFLFSIDKAIIAGLIAYAALQFLDAISQPTVTLRFLTDKLKSTFYPPSKKQPEGEQGILTRRASEAHLHTIYDDYFEKKYRTVRRLKRALKNTAENEDDLRTLFDDYASDHCLNIEDFALFAAALGSRLSKEELEDTIKGLSEEEDKTIRFSNLRNWWKSRTPPQTPASEQEAIKRSSVGSPLPPIVLGPSGSSGASPQKRS